MKHWTRAALALAAAAAVAVCAGATRGGAALNPTFVVTSTGTGANLWAKLADTDSAPARLTVYVPAGYTLAAPSAGRQAGVANVNVITSIGSSEVALLGRVASGAGTPNATDATCDSSPHAAAFTVTATGNATSLSFHVFADRTTGAEAQLGPAKLVACFPPSSSETNDGRVVQLRLRDLPLRAPSRAGDYRWRAVWTAFATPTGAGTGGTAIDTASAVEAESVVHAPQAVAIAATRVGAHSQVVTGRVTGAAGARLVVYSGTSRTRLARAGTARLTAAGTFRLALHAKRTTYLYVSAQAAGRSLGTGGCVSSPALTVTCAGATTGAAQLASRVVVLRP